MTPYIFKSRQVKGHGRGKFLGYPTINLTIPHDLVIEDGIHAAIVIISGKRFMGAMHYGPIPVYKETAKSLEIFLLDTIEDEIPPTENVEIEVEPVAKLRDVQDFPSEDALAEQIGNDVEAARTVLLTRFSH